MSIISDLFSGGAEGLMKGAGAFAKDLREALTGDISAEKKAELMQQAEALQAAMTKAQTDINLADANSGSNFRGGWRPFVGWVGGFAMAYVSIVEPIGRFVAKVGFGYAGEFPHVDTTMTLQVLLGILGLGAMRSFDKVKGNG